MSGLTDTEWASIICTLPEVGLRTREPLLAVVEAILAARLAPVEAIHFKRTISVRGGIVLDYRDICAGCSAIDEDGGVHYWIAWPCPTAAALAPQPAPGEGGGAS